MANAIPAPGFQLISGKRAPPKSLGDKLYVQLRNGIVSKEAWPVETTRWRWQWNEDGTFTPHPGDVVAIKPEHGKLGVKDGRQANGSYE